MEITLEDVWYSYPGQKGWALKGVSASLGNGRLTVVTGPNGSGKTTLLKVAGLLLKPRRGRVLVNGADYWVQPAEKRVDLRRNIVYVQEKPVMLRGSVAYNVAYGLIVRGVRLGEALRRAERALARLGGLHLIDKDARSLSLGEARLVSIARAIAVSPQVLLLDDPFLGLDEEKKKVLLEFLEEYRRRGVSIIVATHETHAIEGADTLLKINYGSLTLANHGRR